MIVQHNLLAQFTYNRLNINSNNLKNNTEKLASGYRINRAADDAAGLTISEKLREQVKGLDKASINSQNAIEFCQVADGAMSEMQSMIHRMKELTVYAANDTNIYEDRMAIQIEIDQLNEEINRIITDTEYNTIKVFERTKQRDTLQTTGGNTIVTDSKIYGVEGNKYGIAEVIGFDNISQTPKLDNAMNYSGSDADWEKTGLATIGYKYGSAWLDFSGAGIDYEISDLNGHGFNSSCATCSKYYSIKFIDGGGTSTTSDGINYNYVSSKSSPSVEIDISSCINGDDIVNAIISVVNSCNEFNNHYTQYAVNTTDNSSKLYIYDVRPDYVNGGGSTFEPVARNADGTPNIINSTIVNDPVLPDISYRYSDYGMWIQVGSNARQAVSLEKPWMNLTMIGVASISVLTQEDADISNNIVDMALGMVSDKRSKIGAFQNRFEHIKQLTDNVSENAQSSESILRDANIAKIMVEYAKNQIIQQSAQAMLTQANSSVEGVLKLLNG